jgi:hypothetical protein
MRVKEGGYALWNGDSIGKKWRSNSLLGAELWLVKVGGEWIFGWSDVMFGMIKTSHDK